MKTHYIVTLFILVVSFPTNAQSDFPQEQKTIDNYTYFEPIYIHQNPNKTDWLYQRFEELSKITLDSVFDTEKQYYKIREKSDLKLTTEIKNELILIFNSNSKEQSTLKFTPNLNLISEAINSRYGIFFLIKTESSITLNTTPISKIRLEVIILDLIQNEFVFYKKSKNLSPRDYGGYAHTLIKNLNNVYKDIYKL